MSQNNNLQQHKDRAIALDRALKFAVLFRKETFPNIQALINTQKNELSVKGLRSAITQKVISENGITEEELKWLENYLKHSTEYQYTDPNDSLPAGVPW
jgi:hypothetical protein